jgi:hypothetical protein
LLFHSAARQRGRLSKHCCQPVLVRARGSNDAGVAVADGGTVAEWISATRVRVPTAAVGQTAGYAEASTCGSQAQSSGDKLPHPCRRQWRGDAHDPRVQRSSLGSDRRVSPYEPHERRCLSAHLGALLVSRAIHAVSRGSAWYTRSPTLCGERLHGLGATLALGIGALWGVLLGRNFATGHGSAGGAKYAPHHGGGSVGNMGHFTLAIHLATASLFPTLSDW